MSDRTQGSVRTGETTPAQGTATGQQPAVDATPSVGSTQTIPGANTARTKAVTADSDAPTTVGPASGAGSRPAACSETLSAAWR